MGNIQWPDPSLFFLQGDGTAFIFKDDDSVFTFSMHCEKNFPLRKQQSDLDVGLDCGLNDEQYLNTVQDYLPWLLDSFRPDLILYDAGVDPHQDDALGKLCLTDQGKRSMYSTILRDLKLLQIVKPFRTASTLRRRNLKTQLCFSNFSSIVWTGPKTKGVEILAREEQIITKRVALRCDQCYRISIANFFLSVQYSGFFLCPLRYVLQHNVVPRVSHLPSQGVWAGLLPRSRTAGR